MIQSFQTSSISSKQIQMKIIFLGNMGTGKSSIIQRFTKNTYHSDQTPTVGIDFLTRIITSNSNSYKLSLWDTAGQEKFLSMISSYLKIGKFCIVVFDVTNRKSFDQLSKWINMYKQHGSQSARIAILANKIDLQRDVSKEESRNYAKNLGYQYYEVSALTGENIQSTFSSLVNVWSRELYEAPCSVPGTIVESRSDGSIPSKQSIDSTDSNKAIMINERKRQGWSSQRESCCHI